MNKRKVFSREFKLEATCMLEESLIRAAHDPACHLETKNRV